MIFTEREIQAALASGQIVIKPPPSKQRYSSTSVDLTLHDIMEIWNVCVENKEVVSPGAPGYSYKKIRDKYAKKIDINNGFSLLPKSFVLGWTAEYLCLPQISKLAARVEGKSSLARLGLGVHLTAPTIHSGFEGQLQLEICNHGPFELKLFPGMSICQIIFETTLGTPNEGYKGQFSQQQA